MTVPGRLAGACSARAADWGDVTTAQADAGPLPYPRGRGLGGSGAINAMAHIRGHRAVYDAWAAGGAAGWGYADLLPYFRRSEHAEGRDPVLRGTGGPVRVAPVPEPDRHPVARAFAEALAAARLPGDRRPQRRRQEGVAWPDLAIAGGRRVSPADAYLRPAMARPEPDRPDRLPGHPPAHPRTAGAPASATCATARRHEAHAVGGGDRVRGRDRLAAAADAVRHRPGRPPARPWASTRWPTCPGSGRTCRTTPSSWPATPRAAPLPAQPVQPRGGLRRAAQPAGRRLARTCTCSRSCCPSRRPGCQAARRRLRPGGRRDRPGQPGHGPAGLRRPARAPLIDPGFLREPADLDRLEAGLAMIRAGRGRRRVRRGSA